MGLIVVVVVVLGVVVVGPSVVMFRISMSIALLLSIVSPSFTGTPTACESSRSRRIGHIISGSWT